MGALHNSKWESCARLYVLEGTSQVDAFRKSYPSASRFSKDTQYIRASEIFKRPQVQARMAELQEVKTELAKTEFEIDARYILHRLAEIDRMDILDIMEDDGSLKPIREWPLVWRQFISAFDVEELFAGRGDERLQVGLLKKIKWPDKVKNLELLGKHIDVSAFKEVRELRGPGGGPVKVITTTMTAQEAADAYADTLNDQ